MDDDKLETSLAGITNKSLPKIDGDPRKSPEYIREQELYESAKVMRDMERSSQHNEYTDARLEKYRQEMLRAQRAMSDILDRAAAQPKEVAAEEPVEKETFKDFIRGSSLNPPAPPPKEPTPTNIMTPAERKRLDDEARAAQFKAATTALPEPKQISNDKPEFGASASEEEWIPKVWTTSSDGMKVLEEAPPTDALKKKYWKQYTWVGKYK